MVAPAVTVALGAGAAISAYILLTRSIPFLDRDYDWKIGVLESDDLLHWRSAAGVRNPVLTGSSITDFDCGFVADPFWIRHENTRYLFFEAVNNSQGKRGEICAAESEDGKNWKYLGTVLREPFHLSYPYVFRHGRDHYMIPESGTENAVYLYKAVSFPDKWVRAATLLQGQPYNDASVIFYQGRWWMFAGTRPYIDDTLCVFYADRLEGPWMPHARNPVVSGNPLRARPAGRPFIAGNGRLVRLAQMDRPYYGRGLKAIEIVLLTPDEFRENDLGALRLDGLSWASSGVHHADILPQEDGRWLACIDGFRWKYAFGLKRRLKFNEDPNARK